MYKRQNIENDLTLKVSFQDTISLGSVQAKFSGTITKKVIYSGEGILFSDINLKKEILDILDKPSY